MPPAATIYNTCPECESIRIVIIDTRHVADLANTDTPCQARELAKVLGGMSSRRRRYRCRRCTHRWTTYEFKATALQERLL